MNNSLKLLFLLSLVGCGAQSQNMLGADQILEESEGFPDSYVMASNSCNKSERLLRPKTKLFSNGNYFETTIDDIDNRFLEKSVVLGGEFEINMERERKFRLTKVNPNRFDYCIEEDFLDEKTFEDATVSILSPLRSFARKYSYLISSYKIPKIKIEVLPRYSNISRKKSGRKKIKLKSYLVNNAMYIGDLNTLVFLPQGENKYGHIPFREVPLWKSPTVVMHEYGHHFFSHITLSSIGNTTLKRSHTSLCMDNTHAGFQTTETSGYKRDTPTKGETLLALNEAFADLFSFYSVGADKQFYKKMDCMENTRDVQKSFFYSGRDKVLSGQAISNFLSRDKNPNQSCDVAVNYQDPHIIGAIFAHSFDEAMSGLGLHSSRKLRIILNWAKNLKQDYEAAKKPEELLEKAAKSFYHKMILYRGFNKTKCQAFKQNFPTVDITCY